MKWSIEKIKAGFEEFYKRHQHYPTAKEIDNFEGLPSSRHLQRMFKGGLPEVRKELGLSGPLDFTKGEHRSKAVKLISKRGFEVESTVYNYLVEKFGRQFVHREYLFTDDHRTRADFYVYHSGGTFLVDVFYPKDLHNFTGCLNSKLRTYRQISNIIECPVIFLMMNEEIDLAKMNKLVSLKKNKLPTHQEVMNYIEFKEFCGKKEPLKLQKP